MVYYSRIKTHKHTLMSTNNYTIIDNTLRFSNNFNKSLNPYRKILRNGKITHLELGSDFNQKLILPSNITSLKLGNNFNRPFILTKNITELSLGNQFNKPIVLTESVINLRLGKEFKQSLVLGAGVKKLLFGEYSMFDHPIILNENLVSASFGYWFNQPLVLTRNQEELVLDYYFDSSIIFAPKLKRLIFRKYSKYNKSLVLGKEILDVRFGLCFYRSIKLHKKVQILKLYNDNYNKKFVPNKHLSVLEIASGIICIGQLSKNISHVQFKFSNVHSVLPKHVKHIIFGFIHSDAKNFRLPPHLKYMDLGNTYDEPIILEHRNSSLEVVVSSFKYSILDNLPNGTCKVTTYQSHLNNLPNTVKELKIRNIYDYDDW